MNTDEYKWAQDAMDLCARAKEKGVSILLIRRQDNNEEGDMAVTNLSDGPALQSLAIAINPRSSED